MATSSDVIAIPGLVSFWDFQEEAGQARAAQGPCHYALQEREGPIERVNEGVFGPYAARLSFGQWFQLQRRNCPALNFHGIDARLTIVAWLKRERRTYRQCQAIAGMWNESERKRQYAMFLDLRIWGSGEQVGGHVSSSGGPTPGHPWCMTAAIGSTPLPAEQWQTVAFTYDGEDARVFVNGKLDLRESYNPFPYPEGLYDGGEEGADFTVGAVHRSGEMGNFFAGMIGGLAVFDRALNEEELAALEKIQ